MAEWASKTRMTKDEAIIACQIEQDINKWLKECDDTGEPIRWAKVGVEEVGVVCTFDREYWQIILYGCYVYCPRLFEMVRCRIKKTYLYNDDRQIVITSG